ncbi:MAG: hypothetical protein ABEH90_02740 [Halolamina sp.]
MATLLLALAAAVISLLATTELFPYRSLNHDESVYLQQAEMLLSGRLYLRPPVSEAFSPWFFVESERGLYPKYAPVPAAVFALGRLLGGFPLALAGISAAIVALTAGVGRELFDARTGLLTGLFVLASPLFLVHAGVYLPYAVTAAFELAFALAYLRGERTGSRRAAAAAGAAIGVAAFARPYTAVLFGLPFVVHACITLVRSGAWRTPFERVWGDGVTDARRGLFTRRLLTAGLGMVGVAIALGYNALVTGDPLVFPYQAFAPEDGIGFGHRQILSHEENYTVSLALEANARVLTRLFTEWVVAGVLGTALAAVGLLVTLRRFRESAVDARPALLAALFLTVPAGNIAFWGNRNILGRLAAPDDGLIQYLGPYYHYDLIVPTALFAAVAVVAGTRWAGTRLVPWFDTVTARHVSLAMLVLSASVIGGVAVTTAEGPVSRNAGVSDELAAGYAPVEKWAAEAGTSESVDGTPETTLVFLPTPYGPWLNHPFQLLRNAAGYEEGTIYALADTRELAVAKAFPERSLYRYVLRGGWDPTDGEYVTGEIRPVERVSGKRIRLTATLGIPAEAESITVRAGGDAGTAYYVATATPERLRLNVTVADGEARVSGPNLTVSGEDGGSFAVAEQDELVIEVFVSTGPGAGSGFSYQFVFPVADEDGRVRALSPTKERCTVPDRCVPAGLGERPDWALAETWLSNASA